jgi:hypothetical protein
VGDLADFCFIQSRPTFDERGKALSPIVARARFDAQVVIEVAQMNDSGLNARTASLQIRQQFWPPVFPVCFRI